MEYSLAVLLKFGLTTTNVFSKVCLLMSGSGKTLISVLLVKEKAEECRQRAQKKLICFLAPKVDLVKQVSLHRPTLYEHITKNRVSEWMVLQQADVLREHTDLKVRDYVGEMGIDAWKLARWQTELDKHNVVVCTPAILLDLLHKAYVKVLSASITLALEHLRLSDIEIAPRISHSHVAHYIADERHWPHRL